jgi:YHS domain-containing protein
MENRKETTEPIVTTCGGLLEHPEKYPRAQFEGKWVYFCTQACLDAFKQNPSAFMRGEIPHPMES